MTSRRPSISDAELDALKVLWEYGPDTVRQVHRRLHDSGKRWAYNTVLTLFQRLEAKGYVRSDKTHVPHVFQALVSRDQLLQRRLTDLANELCEGAATPLVLALVESQRLTTEEIERLRRLLDDLEKK